MDTFGISPGPNVGIIKDFVREAILDGECANEQKAAFELMLKKALSLGLLHKKRTDFLLLLLIINIRAVKVLSLHPK